MAQTISFDEFRNGFSDEELAIFVKCAKKRRLIYFLVCLGLFVIFTLLVYSISPNTFWLYIPALIVAALMGIFAGFGCFANNMVRFVKSQGRRDGGILSVIWALWGGVVVPLIVLAVCRRVNAFGTVLGWDADDARQQASTSVSHYQDGSNGHKLIDDLLDPNNTDPITLTGQDGRVISFKQIAIIPYFVDGQKTMFVLLQPIDKVEGIKDDELVVFRAIPQSDGDVKLLVEPDERIAMAVYDEFQKM